MIRSFCIKTNNNYILNYLLDYFNDNPPENMYFSLNSFKIYDNAIFHYKGENYELFYNYVAKAFLDLIIEFYEDKLISNLLEYNYFYFSDKEKKHILTICKNFSSDIENLEFLKRKSIIFDICKEYIEENKFVILDGFIRFRLQEYMCILDDLVDSAVNSFIIEKEYVEFINLLKFYINSQIPSNKIIHLIYFKNESVLLDEEKNIIKIDTNLTNAKYMSDITFSSNDYCLNTLLNILPKQIFIHLIDANEDEFINTLKNIFGKKVTICFECEMCKKYKTNPFIYKK